MVLHSCLFQIILPDKIYVVRMISFFSEFLICVRGDALKHKFRQDCVCQLKISKQSTLDKIVHFIIQLHLTWY